MGSPTVPRRRREERFRPSGPLVSVPHHGPEGGGRGVEDVDLVLLHDLPETVGLGIVGNPLEHQAGGPCGQRTVNDVAVPGDPADIGGAPEDILIPVIKDPLEGGHDKEEVSRLGVENPFGFPGGTGGIKHEEGIFRIHDLGRAFRFDVRGGHFFMPPDNPSRPSCPPWCWCGCKR